MPGRSRTGSRPSRTVMSFALYVLQPLKKALQISPFRASRSVPDRAAVRTALRGSRQPLLQRFCADFHPRSRRRSPRRAAGPPPWARDPSSRPPNPRRRRAPEASPARSESHSAWHRQAPPRGARAASARAGRARAHADDEVATCSLPSRGEPYRPCVQSPGLVAHDARPGANDLGHPIRRPEARELALNLTADLLRLQAAVLAEPGSTSMSWAGGTGSADAAVAVIRVCLSPGPTSRSASALRLRSKIEAPDKTSSSSSRGGAGPRSASSAASASRRESTARRCSPCEPKRRRSRPAATISTSSRWGPELVLPVPFEGLRPGGSRERRR